VGAEFADTAVLNHHHQFRIVCRVQAMRDGDHRAPLEEHCDRALEMARRTRVEQGSRLVENERMRIGEE